MYSVSNPSTFSIRQPNKDYSVPEIIYATFTLQSGAAYINPVKLSSQGYFTVTMPDTTMAITFICNEPYTNVIGNMNLDSSFGFSVSKPSLNSIEFEISGISGYVFATMSLIVSKY
jgi:hypothetical protein